MSKKYLSRGPELLQDFQSRLELNLREHGIKKEEATRISLSITQELTHAWGGQNIYFPKGTSFRAQSRDWQIFNEFNGSNHVELAKKYQLAIQHIYRIIALCRKKRKEKTEVI
ncbi:Mor transcription activator family protein [Desulfovibrio litoralis]|uniref:Mor transcription activator family protein n=1 Tax=Desulfovibrio litoralis DSM 11393 TaxID=1121455 RepID=A0A1M7TIZ5_9BACT|nr:Mor transcription activator family protein [Desulfovibrio litoralis]SHN70603.1 Mor transcription activator family protein [Desulfovibrio litoralis DSM 11393]